MRITDAMIDRFLAWPLPEEVAADPLATTPAAGRTGTMLLTAEQARTMLEYVLLDPSAPPPPLAQPSVVQDV